MSMHKIAAESPFLDIANRVMSDKVHRGRLDVASAVLCGALHLPAGTIIVGARMNERGDGIEFILDHASFKPIEFGSLIPSVSVMFTTQTRSEIVDSSYTQR